MTEEHKRKIALSKIGKPSGSKGKHWKVKDASKMGIKKGSSLPKQSPEHLKKRIESRDGYKHSEETKRKMSEKKINKPIYKMRGANHFAWKGGISSLQNKLRGSLEYKIWRRAVFERDNYTCIWCKRKKEVSGKLNADHIKPFAHYPELRFAIDNGRTLCEECHKTTNTYLWKGIKKQSNS